MFPTVTFLFILFSWAVNLILKRNEFISQITKQDNTTNKKYITLYSPKPLSVYTHQNPYLSLSLASLSLFKFIFLLLRTVNLNLKEDKFVSQITKKKFINRKTANKLCPKIIWHYTHWNLTLPLSPSLSFSLSLSLFFKILFLGL